MNTAPSIAVTVAHWLQTNDLQPMLIEVTHRIATIHGKEADLANYSKAARSIGATPRYSADNDELYFRHPNQFTVIVKLYKRGDQIDTTWNTA